MTDVKVSQGESKELDLPGRGARALTGPQEVAISALLSGATQRAAAEQAGLAEETVCRWLANDVRFAAELNRRRAELWRAHRTRLLALADRALAVIEASLSDASGQVRLKAAQTVLHAWALDERPLSFGPTTPAEVEHELDAQGVYLDQQRLLLDHARVRRAPSP